ncbi:bifunctional DNA primase/polymerase [Nonomuraea sp. NPDC050680]|uniref:bifunctional DNA primase/polymerase n=1 Tax=Nonomuraea sp. NPDC050680 TaxID=3154630 RepID=UPI0033D06302
MHDQKSLPAADEHGNTLSSGNPLRGSHGPGADMVEGAPDLCVSPGHPRLQAMLSYAAHGWPVFVLSSSKAPLRNCDRCRDEHVTPEQMETCPCLTCHGFYAATTDPERIRAMDHRVPRGLVAIRTGGPSGTVVIDVDAPGGLKTMAKLDEGGILPGTVTAATGSGGLHLVYRHPGVRIPSGVGKAGPQIDVKADGGYIVVAPSLHPRTGQPYRWMNDRFALPLATLHPALLERLREKPPRPRKAARESRTGSMRGRLNGLVRTVLKATPGERNAVLYWAACCAGQMVAQGAIDEATAYEVLWASGLEIGLTESELGAALGRGTIGSGMRRGMRAS